MINFEGADFWSGRAVAVIGATGFIGHHLAIRLKKLGAQVMALIRPTSAYWRLAQAGIRLVEGSLEDGDSLARCCQGNEFVFHLAGLVDFKGEWDRLRLINVEGTRQVVAAALAAGVRRLIYTSSVVAVGASTDGTVLDETAAWNLGPYRVPYVTTKREAEELALASSDRSLEVVAVNPGSVVGPDDFSSSEFGTLCQRFWRGKIPLHFGGGNNFVDVRDVAVGHLLAAERGRPGQRYILGGHNKTYGAFFASLAHAAGRPIFRLRVPNAFAPIVATLNQRLQRGSRSKPYLTQGQASLLALFFYFDSRKAEAELGYRPRRLRKTLSDAHAFWMEKCHP